jgi:hypothetical protein
VKPAYRRVLGQAAPVALRGEPVVMAVLLDSAGAFRARAIANKCENAMRPSVRV